MLAIDRASAQAEYLLGLVEDAQGDAQGALVHYRRALYLDPEHYEALVHCAALLDARGDVVAAKRLLERADRAGGKQSAGSTGSTGSMESRQQTAPESHDQTHRQGTRHR